MKHIGMFILGTMFSYVVHRYVLQSFFRLFVLLRLINCNCSIFRDVMCIGGMRCDK